MDVEQDRHALARTGVAGLDEVLAGGLTTGHVFLLEGNPGTGKTTIALRFLLEGAAQGEKGLYVTLSETAGELRNGAASHGWSIPPNVEIFELVPAESLLDADQQQTLLYSSDLELGEATTALFQAFERVKPSRLVLDSLSEIRLLAQNSLRYRRQILALKHYFVRHGATVLMLDDRTTEQSEKTAHSVVHGVVLLEELNPSYGTERRRLRVSKYRGQAFRGGFHDFTIKTGGVAVFPRLVAAEHHTWFDREQRQSGIAGLDALLGGGIHQGSSTLVLGAAGTGKSTLTFQFVAAACRRGERAAMFVFDEEVGLMLLRAKAVGLDLQVLCDDGLLHIEHVDAAELSPGEFAERVRSRVDEAQAKTIVIDSLNGYESAMPEEGAMVLHVHELIQYLNRQGANTFLTVAQHGVSAEIQGAADLTYLADNVVLLRYFECEGRVRRAISVVKKRTGPHEEWVREFCITPNGLTFSEPIRHLRGILQGTLRLDGTEANAGQSLLPGDVHS